MDENEETINTIPLENIEELDSKYAFDNETEPVDLEIEPETETTVVEEELEIVPETIEKKKKKSFKEFWNTLTKKQKIIALVVSAVVILGIVSTIVFFVLKDKKDDTPKKDVIENIVVKDNYKYADGKLIFLDEDDNEIGTYNCVNADEALCFVAYESNEDYFDIPKKVFESGDEYQKRSQIYHEKYVFVSDSKAGAKEELILYNIASNESEGTYSVIKSYNIDLENAAILSNDSNMYGLVQITKDGIKNVLDFKYDFLGIITENKNKHDKIVATEKDKNYLIDYTGKKLTKVIPDQIREYNDSHIKAVDLDDKYSVYDYNANVFGSTTYDYVTLLDEYMGFVKSNKLYIIDYKGNKMYEEGIGLFSGTYVPVMTYDSDGKHLSTDYSYALSIMQDTINVDAKVSLEEEEYFAVPLAEGIVSSKQKYFSYFAGKLYFYSDLEKNTLLGTYTCANENKAGMGDTKFTSCLVASDDNTFIDNDMETEIYSNRKVIPIYNSRFVFITDQPALSSEDAKTVVLYDLVGKKNIAKYSSVLSYDGSIVDEVTLKDTNGTYIVAKNQSGNFGVIKVTKTDVTSAVAFANQHIEKLGTNLLIKKNDKWFLSDYTGNATSAEFTGKIRSYQNNYVTVKEGNDYYIYHKQGGSRFDLTDAIYNGCNYIGLYSGYFVAVKNSALYVFNYDKSAYTTNSTGIPLTSIPLNSTKYYQNGTSEAFAFKTYMTSGSVFVEVLNADKNSSTTYKYEYGGGS